MFNLFKRQDSYKDVPKDQLTLTVRASRCPANHKCPAVRVCPVNAIKQKEHGVPNINMNICIKCGKCIKFCPTGAIAYEVI